MLQVSEDKLKLTLRPGLQKGETVPLDISKSLRTQARKIVQQLVGLQERIAHAEMLQPVFRVLQSHFVDTLYQNEIPDYAQIVQMRGANDSQLHCEIFNPGTAHPCTSKQFVKRTHLKLKRTLLNLEELKKAYPDHTDLHDLEDMLLHVNDALGALSLQNQLLDITLSSAFTSYSNLKIQFLEEWLHSQETSQGQADDTPLSESELSNSMKALLEQRPQLQNSEILKYKDQQFFRRFNTQAHQELNSQTMDFWKTEDNQKGFAQFIESLRTTYPGESPFLVFRFDHSFTYLLCGFPDDQLVQAIQQGMDSATLHAKIIMRQSNQIYRELTSFSTANRTLYFNCLKEAMAPFIRQLNQNLRLDLPASFLSFFEI